MSEPIQAIKTPVRFEYTVTAGHALSRFLRGIMEGKLIGERCPVCLKVYVPARGACPTCAVATRDAVEVKDTGTITTFCVVNIPVEGKDLELPYVVASIVLDGADIEIFHLIREMPAKDVRMGLRVKAVWAPPEKRAPTLESILYFKPTGEPDAPYESYREHV
jgi:uncharacterized OB-fold protein